MRPSRRSLGSARQPGMYDSPSGRLRPVPRRLLQQNRHEAEVFGVAAISSGYRGTFTVLPWWAGCVLMTPSSHRLLRGPDFRFAHVNGLILGIGTCTWCDVVDFVSSNGFVSPELLGDDV